MDTKSIQRSIHMLISDINLSINLWDQHRDQCSWWYRDQSQGSLSEFHPRDQYIDWSWDLSLQLLSKINPCITISLSISGSRDQYQMLIFDISEINTGVGIEINMCIDHKINLKINLCIDFRDQTLRSIQR